MLIGENGLKRLSECHAAVFGIGGVGGYVVEALARCGIGEFTLVDKDVVSMSNLNRQDVYKRQVHILYLIFRKVTI